MDFQSKSIKLMIGLGNPGADYENTYHNAGAIFIDFLISQKGKNYFFAKGLSLAKNRSFMNESGGVIKKALTDFKAKTAEIVIIHDDSDLRLGESKFSFGRGAGGHKGVASAIKALKTKNFWRLRIGIRPPKEKIRAKAESFVLKKIKSSDKKILESLFCQIAEKNL